MGIIRIIVIVLAVAIISGLVRSFLAKRHPGKFPGTRNADFISEELYKLNELKNRGIITEEEFQKQKKKLIG
ncbi:SHOCT domain-containing protein [Bacteroides sp. 519]|uniref:SHOCT domain-containing protein n=1 Tax=Bacteroides sp. 519 TaxID=2302937 RepID=UPI0013D45BFF|nr:SHOCT domain-containing protein [Bacteroides sp. 519]NDV58501.1 SHOCT domain-containing protein [Bacteroides sp. 519]